MSNDNNLLRPFRMPNPIEYWQEKSGEFFKQKPAEDIKANEQGETMITTLKDLYEHYQIKDIRFGANGSVQIDLLNGLTANARVKYGMTRLYGDVYQTTEADKVAALAEVLERNQYDIAACAASHSTAKKHYERQMLAVNERIQALQEIGVKELTQKHLPRVNKVYMLATMSNGAQLPFYANYEMVKQPADYEAEFMEYMKEHVELWTAPCEDPKALQTNAAREFVKVPSSFINLK